MELIFATRPSALARWQTQWVVQALMRAWPDLSCREEIITTQGDRILDRPLPEIGGTGLFTQELENALLSGRVHAAVHSLKDLPVENPPGLILAAIPAREDARDVLISPQGCSLETLPEGARVGTSSLRRSAQLLSHRPDLVIKPLRGNVDTRLRKAFEGQYDAIILAGAGVKRLGLVDRVTEWLPLEVMLPAPGQGALSVQCRADDLATQEILAAIEDRATRMAVEAERTFLASLGGGCSVPVAAYAEFEAERVQLRGLVAVPDGSRVVRCSATSADPRQVGMDCAGQALANDAGRILGFSTISTPTGPSYESA